MHTIGFKCTAVIVFMLFISIAIVILSYLPKMHIIGHENYTGVDNGYNLIFWRNIAQFESGKTYLQQFYFDFYDEIVREPDKKPLELAFMQKIW